VVARDVGGDVVAAAAQVLDERVTGGEDPRSPVALQSAYRPEPGFEPSVVCFDRVVRVLLDCVQGRGDQLVEHSGVGGGTVTGDLGRDRAGPHGPGEKAPDGRRVTPDR
jgi:hypothetical protein